MQKFSWKGINKLGNNCKGFLFAESDFDLKEKLLEQGVALINCKKTSSANLDKVFSCFKKVQQIEIINFLQNLSVLLESGIDLLLSLSLVRKQTKNKKFKNIIEEIEDDVGQGQTFAASLEKQDFVFSKFIIWMINVGEKTGKLDFVLKQLTNFLLIRFNLTKSLKQAAILPVMTLIFSLLIILGIFIFIVPQFETVFVTVGKNLPSSTRFILKISNFLRSDYIFEYFLLFSVFLVFSFFLFSFSFIKKIRDKLFLNIYFLKDVILYFDLISLLSVLSISLKSGIPLKDGLNNSLHTIKNLVFKQKLINLITFVNQGEPLTSSLKSIGHKFFPEGLIIAISVGEQTGNLDAMIEKQLTFFKGELDSKLRIVTTLIQPVLMILVGILIAILILSIYLPIFDMANLF